MGRIDWRKVLMPDTPLLEIFIRGSVVYLALFLMLRFVLKRQTGVVGVTDLLAVVLIADAAQNAMSSTYTSIPDGLLLVGTILFWCNALDWHGFHIPRLERLLRPPPLPLIKNGCLLRRNMRFELISPSELMSLLREQGIDDPSRVRSAWIEGDGRIGVIPLDGPPRGRTERRIG